uniref:Sugar fermentation stimulation protein putative n=1 Tax=Albugo laibachii Nc14 TaxID=890382 RepID=F0WAA5_9STRA|nr:sugar fermentation stimulation protein putative [Albugo laibachii Nc14]|eukprot:CCA18075.1 sugar fermentation stimulation protein putative [Albugo laibachii Nc14]
MSTRGIARSSKRAKYETDEVTIESTDVLYDYGELIKGKLIRRYKRFLADVVVSGLDPEIITVYCPNTGPMLRLLDTPEAPVLLSITKNAKRKYKYTLEMIHIDNGEKSVWVGIHSALANRMVEEALNMRLIPELGEYDSVLREVSFGMKKSRVDFVLKSNSNEAKQKMTYVEVKSVTLTYSDSEQASDSNYAVFPDTVSERAQRHVAELIEQVSRSRDQCASSQLIEAAIVFLVQRDDVEQFSPSVLHDPRFASLCLEAEKHGVLLLAFSRSIVEYAPNQYQAMLARRLPIIHNQASVTQKDDSTT